MSLSIAKAAGLPQTGAIAHTAATDVIGALADRVIPIPYLPPAPSPAPAAPVAPGWIGIDLDGDGQPDVANPTGKGPRGIDAFGDGAFHASRDGGTREHEGVDYIAAAGQVVDAPLSGYVTKIGFAYPGDPSLKFVEIDNPALRMQARVFYVDPAVSVGQAVSLGEPIGKAHTLQRRYRGITNHVHLEFADASGRKLDAQSLILAVGGGAPRALAIN